MTARSHASNGQRPATATLLVVDDNDALRSVVQPALPAANLNCGCIGSVSRALAAIENQPVSAILTDLSMPDMDGWEFCRLARKRCPHAVLAIMTGWGAPADEATLVESGIRFVLAKPFNLRELQALMLEALS